jgi:hypothetical protein
MTPEELEEIQGIGPDMVEKIQVAVNAYYAQFDGGGEAAEVEASPHEVKPAEIALDSEASLDEVEAAQGHARQAGPQDEAGPQNESLDRPADVETETGEAVRNSVETPDSVVAESDRINDIGSSVKTPDEDGEVHES